MSEQKNTGNVARGLKAAIHNPNVGQDAKIDAQARLNEISGKRTDRGTARTQLEGEEDADYVPPGDDVELVPADDPTYAGSEELGGAGGEKMGSRQLGGYKATLKNPHVSDEAKEKAAQILEDNNAF